MLPPGTNPDDLDSSDEEDNLPPSQVFQNETAEQEKKNHILGMGGYYKRQREAASDAAKLDQYSK